MLLSCHHNAEQNHNIKTANRPVENGAQFKYLGMTLATQNLIQEEIKRRLILGNACYHSVYNLSSRLLCKNVKIRTYKTIILPVVLYGCETWPLTLKDEHRLEVFGNMVLRRIFGLKMDDIIGGWRKLHEELHNLYSSTNIAGITKSRRMGWACSMHGREEYAHRILVEIQKDRDD
jgi:hypothetical protein